MVAILVIFWYWNFIIQYYYNCDEMELDSQENAWSK